MRVKKFRRTSDSETRQATRSDAQSSFQAGHRGVVTARSAFRDHRSPSTGALQRPAPATMRCTGVNAPAVVLLQAEGHLRMPLPRIARVEIKESATLQPFEPQSHVAADQGA